MAIRQQAVGECVLARPCLREPTRVPQIRFREPLHCRELGTKIRGKTSQYATTPWLDLLPLNEGVADVPPQRDHLGVRPALHREPRFVSSLHDKRECLRVPGREDVGHSSSIHH